MKVNAFRYKEEMTRLQRVEYRPSVYISGSVILHVGARTPLSQAVESITEFYIVIACRNRRASERLAVCIQVRICTSI